MATDKIPQRLVPNLKFDQDANCDGNIPDPATPRAISEDSERGSSNTLDFSSTCVRRYGVS